MSKGISTIIAAIMLVIITIGLAGTAYLFFSNYMTSRVAKIIDVLSISCNNNGTHSNITIVLANRGSDDIQEGEIKVLVNNKEVIFSKLTPLTAGNVTVGTNTTQGTGKTDIMIIGPSNAITQTIWC